MITSPVRGVSVVDADCPTSSDVGEMKNVINQDAGHRGKRAHEWVGSLPCHLKDMLF
jgi:hypothetical protein